MENPHIHVAVSVIRPGAGLLKNLTDATWLTVLLGGGAWSPGEFEIYRISETCTFGQFHVMDVTFIQYVRNVFYCSL